MLRQGNVKNARFFNGVWSGALHDTADALISSDDSAAQWRQTQSTAVLF